LKRKSKNVQKPGYREPRSAAEQRYWDCYIPDLRKWARKSSLTIDEAAALAMDLDPRCIEWMSDEKRTHERFLATKAWFLRNKDIFLGRIDLERLWVLGRDNGEDNIPLNSRVSHMVDLKQVGFLNIEKKLAGLERQIEKLKKDKVALEGKLASMVPSSRKKTRATDELHYEKTSSKLIVALMAARIGNEAEWKRQFAKIKNGNRSVGVVSGVIKAVNLLGWKIDESSVLERFRVALRDYNPEENLTDI
jgi:hypothetical protein